MCFHDSLGVSNTSCCPHAAPLELLSKMQSKAAALHRFPGLSLHRLSGMSALAFCFFHCTPPQLSHRGPTSPRIGVCDPGAQTALHINLPGPPAVRLSAAAPLLRRMCCSHTSVRQPCGLPGLLEIQTSPSPSLGLHLSCPVSFIACHAQAFPH